MSESTFIKLNGNLQKKEEAAVSPFNRGMMYGDGCFETIRSYEGKFLGWDSHIERLESGLDYLGMISPFSEASLKQSINHLLAMNSQQNEDAMVRIQCWRAGERGYGTDATRTNWIIETQKLTSKDNPLKLILAQTRCIPAEALERKYKLSNGLNYIIAAREAQHQHADDALMLTVGDNISETTKANIFWVKENTIFTPSDTCDLLPGVTRSIIIEICKKKDYKLDMGQFGIQSIQDAETVFCTNSLIEVQEVSALDKQSFQINHPVFKKIKSGFERYKETNLHT